MYDVLYHLLDNICLFYLGRYFVKISGEVNTMGNAFYFCMPDNGMAQLMAMITWAKKKFKQIYQYRAKRPVVLRLIYPPIWADLAEHANCYLLKECCFLIFL